MVREGTSESRPQTASRMCPRDSGLPMLFRNSSASWNSFCVSSTIRPLSCAVWRCRSKRKRSYSKMVPWMSPRPARRTRAFRRARSSPARAGLTTKSSAPASSALMTSLSASCEVSTMTGSGFLRSRSSRTSALPSMPGSMRSTMQASKLSRGRAARKDAASLKRWHVSPSTLSEWTSCEATALSSSMIAILIAVFYRTSPGDMCIVSFWGRNLCKRLS